MNGFDSNFAYRKIQIFWAYQNWSAGLCCVMAARGHRLLCLSVDVIIRIAFYNILLIIVQLLKCPNASDHWIESMTKDNHFECSKSNFDEKKENKFTPASIECQSFWVHCCLRRIQSRYSQWSIDEQPKLSHIQKHMKHIHTHDIPSCPT